jgi:MFS transporter, DHA1 family, multidrug resistance protein
MEHDTRVAWILAGCTALALFGDSTLYAVLPSQHEQAGVTLAAVGWLLSVNRLVRIPLNVFSGWLADRVGPKAPYVVGIALGVVSTAGYGLVSGFWPLMALRALWGLAWTLIAVSAYTLLLNVSDPARRGRQLGLYASFSFLGGALGSILGGYLTDTRGYGTAMLALGACTGVGWTLAAVLVPRVTPPERQTSDAVPLTWRGVATRARTALSALRASGRSLGVILLLNGAHRFFFAGVFYATFGRYLLLALGEETRLGGALIGVASLTGALLFARNVITALVGPLIGHFSDMLGDRGRVLVLGEVCGIVGLAVCGLSGHPVAILLGVLCAATAYGIVPPMLTAWMGDITDPSRRGPVVGLYQTLGDIGSGVAPAVVYPAMALIGLSWVYLLSAVFLAATIPLILWASRPAAPIDA